MPNDEFQLVTSKKGSKSRKTVQQVYSSACNSQREETIISKAVSIERILSAQRDITASDFYASTLASFTRALELIGNPIVKDIVCFGLGHFVDSVTSRYQFALLLALKDYFSAEVYVHDPIFYNSENNIISTLGCQLIEENEEGKRSVTVTTLAYLPHCPKQLTNNFLWSNWGAGLHDCIIFGNSFSKLVESSPSRILKNSVRYILDIHDYLEEIEVENSFKYTDIFNDSAIHIFPDSKLNLLTQDFWDLHTEPKYSEDDIELITKSFKPTLQL